MSRNAFGEGEITITIKSRIWGLGGGLATDGRLRLKIKSKIRTGTGEGHTPRGHLTRYTVTTSVNTGDFVHLTRYISRYMPLPEP